jgi:hypothetical protein
LISFLAVGVMAFAIACLAFLFGAAGLWKLWNEGAKAGAASLRGMLMAGLTLAPAAYAGVQSVRLPQIADVSTDLANPPRFPIGARNAIALPFGTPVTGPAAALLQAAAYPDLSPRLVEVPVAEALIAVNRAADALGWERGPGAGGLDSNDGILRGFSDTTLILGFTDDIVVRILPAGNRLVVDMRSASRIGQSDLGANAARIRSFMAALDKELLALAK